MIKQDLSFVNNYCNWASGIKTPNSAKKNHKRNYFNWSIDLWGFIIIFSLILHAFGMVHHKKLKGTKERGLWREGDCLNLPIIGPTNLWFSFPVKTETAPASRDGHRHKEAVSIRLALGAQSTLALVTRKVRGLDQLISMALSSWKCVWFQPVSVTP